MKELKLATSGLPAAGLRTVRMNLSFGTGPAKDRKELAATRVVHERGLTFFGTAEADGLLP